MYFLTLLKTIEHCKILKILTIMTFIKFFAVNTAIVFTTFLITLMPAEKTVFHLCIVGQAGILIMFSF